MTEDGDTLERSSTGGTSVADGDDFVRLLLDSTGDGIYGVDLNGICTFANPACARLLGFDSVEALLGQHMHNLVHHTRPNGESYPVEECKIYQAISRGEGTHVDDEVMYCADGKPFPVEYWSYPVRRDGELVGCVVTFVDITERRRNEDLLAEVARLPEMNPGPVVRVDSDGTVRLANTAARTILGEDVVGRSWREHICEIDDEVWSAILAATQPFSVEKQIGDRVFVFVHRRDFEGDLVFVFGTDITDQKRAENALRIYSRMVSASTDFLSFVDRDFVYQAVNDSYLKAFEKTRDEVIGRGLPETLGEAVFEQVERNLQTALEGEHVDYQSELDLPGSGLRHLDVHINPFRGTDGEVSGILVNARDVTEQKEAERALKEAHEQVRLLLDSTGEGIYGIDTAGNCTFANPACAELLGYDSTDEFLGQNMHELVHHTRVNGDAYPVNECHIYRAFHRGEGTHVDDEVMFRADGESFPVEYWSYPIDRSGELVGCVVTFVDITDRRRVENELRQTEKMAALGKLSAGLAHELNNPAAAAGRAAGQLDEAIGDLQAATIELARTGLKPAAWSLLNERLEELRGRAASLPELSPLEASDREEELLVWLDDHEIENSWEIAPVFVSIGIEPGDLDAIANEVPDAPMSAVMLWICRSITAGDLAGVVSRSAKSISDLVNVVKSYSYMDKAPSLYVDVHDGLEDTLVILKHKLKQGIEVTRDYDRDLPEVRAQGSELNQVWTNLLDNAIAAMDGKGTISIRTYREGEYVVVAIGDNGPGIPDEIQSRIFEPFFTTKDVGEGTGLGLDVVNRIVTSRCGGRIDFDSGPEGTTFRVQIPIEIACPSSDE